MYPIGFWRYEGLENLYIEEQIREPLSHYYDI